jgi:hypothetical protein
MTYFVIPKLNLQYARLSLGVIFKEAYNDRYNFNSSGDAADAADVMMMTKMMTTTMMMMKKMILVDRIRNIKTRMIY